jgi:putative glycosyltransferase (TIGR04372 family)
MGLGDLSYQSNRNADVNNYLMAANALAQRGIYVLRMGKIVLDDMKTSNPMIIDYAKSRFRSDFMDVFLAKNCLFSMGTNNGFLALPLLFRRPFLETDLPTLGWIYSYSESSLSLAKTLINCSSGEKMSLVEILKSPVAFSNRNHVFSNNGIQVVDNTPEQITAVTMEMLNRVHNINQYSSSDRFLQDRFRDLYLSAISEPSKVIHRNFRGSYSIDALRNDSHFLK